MWPLPSGCCQTSSAWVILSQLVCWKTVPTSLRHSLLNCTTSVCRQARCQHHSKQPTLRRCWRSLTYIRPTCSYQPISNPSVLSKLLERLLAWQLPDHLTAAKLLPELQSVCRAHHSTETAVFKVLADILSLLDTSELAVINVARLVSSIWYGWPHYLVATPEDVIRYRWQCTGVVQIISQWPYPVGPLQNVYFRCLNRLVCSTYLLYTADLLRLVEHQNLQPHMYANNTQIYGFCRPAAATQLHKQVSACIDVIAVWMQLNQLQLNTVETKVIWCTLNQRQHQLPQVTLRVGTDHVIPTMSFHDLGIYLDCN